MSNQGVQDFYNKLNDVFNSGNVNNLDGLDPFPADDTDALVLTAKMSLLQVNIFQQLIMLGSAQGENSTLKAFAATAAGKIGVRGRQHAPGAHMHGLVTGMLQCCRCRSCHNVCAHTSAHTSARLIDRSCCWWLPHAPPHVDWC